MKDLHDQKISENYRNYIKRMLILIAGIKLIFDVFCEGCEYPRAVERPLFLFD